jgi:hypothetical protein
LRRSFRTDDAHTAFRLPKNLLTTSDTICREFDLTRSQLFRRSIAEFIKSRAYECEIMGQLSNQDNKRSQSIVRSVRLSPAFLELIKQEASLRKTSFSEFVRQSILGNLRYMRRQAIETWGREAL